MLLLIVIVQIWISSLNWFCALVLWLFCTHDWSTLFSVFFFHLRIEKLPFFKYFHQFSIHFITIQLFQNVLLMIKLILRLFCLFSSLLSLYYTKSILRLLLLLNILTMTLSTSFLYLSRLILSNLTIWLFLIKFFIWAFGKLIFVIDYMHWQTLIG